MPARTRQDLPIGTVIGVHEVMGASFPRKVPGRSGQSRERNRYFVPIRCTGCNEPSEAREDRLKGLETSYCAYCFASPDNDPEARIRVQRVWNGRVQVYDRYRFHGRSRDRLHSVWTSMRERCSNPTSEKYARYGGRGIKVDPAWDHFLTFAAWAKANGYTDGLTIDRINNDGSYGPGNCRWVTDLENLLNRSRYLSTPLHEALDARAATDGIDTYTVIRRALESLRHTTPEPGEHHDQ